MCKVLKVSPSSYYNWKKNPISKRQQRNDELLGKIKNIWIKSKGTYGSPRITKELNINGTKVSQKMVARSMRKNNIKSRTKRKYKITTDYNHKYPTAPNKLIKTTLFNK